MFLSRIQVRALDRRASAEFGIPSILLMENAGRGIAELLLSLGVHGQVAICCGKGNNGGDGFVIARHLEHHRIPVQLHLFAAPTELSGDAAVNYHIALQTGFLITTWAEAMIPVEKLRRELLRAEWIVDALFGTGLTGALRSPFDQVVVTINGCPAHVLSVDIPSGLDCDTGFPLGPTVQAHHTATLVAQKLGFRNPEARPWLGQVHVLPIGLPQTLLASCDSSTH